MNTFEITTPIYKFHYEDNNSVKKEILSAIESMGVNNKIDENQNIYNTDWHRSDEKNRPYFNLVQPIISKFLTELGSWEILDVWFQQYKKDNFHSWHKHGNCMYSSVYYVELPEKGLNTTFRMNGEEFEIPVEEGDYIVFPSLIEHCSKQNPFDETKTSIAFNLNIMEN